MKRTDFQGDLTVLVLQHRACDFLLPRHGSENTCRAHLICIYIRQGHLSADITCKALWKYLLLLQQIICMGLQYPNNFWFNSEKKSTIARMPGSHTALQITYAVVVLSSGMTLWNAVRVPLVFVWLSCMKIEQRQILYSLHSRTTRNLLLASGNDNACSLKAWSFLLYAVRVCTNKVKTTSRFTVWISKHPDACAARTNHLLCALTRSNTNVAVPFDITLVSLPVERWTWVQFFLIPK